MEELPEITVTWKKPESIPHPKVWKEFTAKRKDGQTIDLVIQDVPSDRMEDVVNFMLTHYIRDEPLCNSSNLLSDEMSVAIYQYVFIKALEAKISLVAFVKDENNPKPEIAGVYILTVYSKADPPLPEVHGTTIRKLIDIFYAARVDLNVFEILQADEHLNDWGVCVAPEYRGFDIGYQLISTLPQLASTIGVYGAMMLYTSKYSQSIADRCGFKVYKEIVYDEYRDWEDKVIFPVKDTKSVKLMGIKFPAS